MRKGSTQAVDKVVDSSRISPLHPSAGMCFNEGEIESRKAGYLKTD